MKKIDNEKVIERTLVTRAKKNGFKAIKMECNYEAGLPDRMLIGEGMVGFFELKTTGKKPTKLQLRKHQELRELGFPVHVVDSIDQLNRILEEHYGFQATRISKTGDKPHSSE